MQVKATRWKKSKSHLEEVEGDIQRDHFRKEECQTNNHREFAVQGTRNDEQRCPVNINKNMLRATRNSFISVFSAGTADIL